MNGYMGKILMVDLTKMEIKDEPLNEQYARDFIGAGGIACRYLADMVDEKTDPLGSTNPLIFMAGLLTGTGAPSFSRWVVASARLTQPTTVTPTAEHFSGPRCASPGMTASSSRANRQNPFTCLSGTARQN